MPMYIIRYIRILNMQLMSTVVVVSALVLRENAVGHLVAGLEPRFGVLLKFYSLNASLVTCLH